MMKDKAIENLFSTAKHTFDDEERFMKSLVSRLEAVEYIKQHEEATLRRYRYAIVAAFIMGITCGGIMALYLHSAPMSEPLFTLDTTSGILLTLERNSRMIATTILLLIIGWGIFGSIITIMDIYSMKSRMASMKAL